MSRDDVWMERKLVTFRTVSEIRPIKDADKIELAIVDGWQVIVVKNTFAVGDIGCYFEVDSFLPMHEYFEFLKSSSYKKMGEEEGYRLRTIRMRGELSQGLLLPLAQLSLSGNEDEESLADLLGVKKYEPPIPAQLMGTVAGMFPSFIPKTDQERVQNLVGKIWGTGRTITYTDAEGNLVAKEIPPAPKRKYELSEKIDGSSTTVYNYCEKFGVCSRNLELLEDENNTYWKVANKYSLKEKLAGKNVALQGELAGGGIQGNPLKLKGQDIYIFDIYDIDSKQYLSPEERDVFLKTHIPEIPTVPILARNFDLPESCKELLEYVQGKSALNPKQDREGVVFKEESSIVNRFTFKGISNKYLLSQKD